MNNYKDISVPSFFPAVTSECKEKAAKFFICIEDKMQYMNQEDINGAKRGLTICENLMNEYKECMQASLAKGSERLL
ncbi:hypothetical protein CYY_002054 [Polysphondylium violaceum]|uniref:Uncharacterized protein n=1 Tax=Polysphondylium violaceum TaxID=133409 RepID=A0A8J4Q014_9MYCE|nr:hypothetical protein CYY_002054 [Polysphondylium violaceum]